MHCCGLRLQEVHRAAAHAIELLRQRGNGELVAMEIQEREQQEVATKEGVLREVRALEAEDARDGGRRIDDRHVARLAALRVAVRAVLPFEVRHLLGEMRDDFPAAVGLRVERVARGAQLGLLDVGGLGRHEQLRRRVGVHAPQQSIARSHPHRLVSRRLGS